MASPSTPTTPVRVTVVSESMVKPAFISEDAKKPHYLSPLDISGLNYDYLQFGLLFNKPGSDQPMQMVLDRLKTSLATTLTQFVPFSGRFVTQLFQHPPSYSVYVDCNDPPGAGFVHAVASKVTISDLLAPTYVPRDIIKSLFTLPLGTPNRHGHTLPLLVVRVNELVDGIFIGFTANHSLVDGIPFWHFINSYSEACRSKAQDFVISRPPVITTWFSEDQVRFPGSPPNPSSDEIFATPHGTYEQRVFHFSSGALASLKMKANNEHGTRKISTFQALTALIWRAVTRARGLSGNQLTTCAIPVNCRSKVEPPLSDVYFGNFFLPEYVMENVNELLKSNLGSVASKLHDGIMYWDHNRVLSSLEEMVSSADYTMDEDVSMVVIGSSPRFNVYGNNFGWGTPLAMRWFGEFFDGVVHVYSGRDNGSIDLLVDLYSEYMNALESDDEFMNALSCMKLSKF